METKRNTCAHHSMHLLRVITCFYVTIGINGTAMPEFMEGLFNRKITICLKTHNITEAINTFQDECLTAFILSVYRQGHRSVGEVICWYPADYIKTREALAVMV